MFIFNALNYFQSCNTDYNNLDWYCLVVQEKTEKMSICVKPYFVYR